MPESLGPILFLVPILADLVLGKPVWPFGALYEVIMCIFLFVCGVHISHVCRRQIVFCLVSGTVVVLSLLAITLSIFIAADPTIISAAVLAAIPILTRLLLDVKWVRGKGEGSEKDYVALIRTVDAAAVCTAQALAITRRVHSPGALLKNAFALACLIGVAFGLRPLLMRAIRHRARVVFVVAACVLAAGVTKVSDLESYVGTLVLGAALPLGAARTLRLVAAADVALLELVLPVFVAVLATACDVNVLVCYLREGNDVIAAAAVAAAMLILVARFTVLRCRAGDLGAWLYRCRGLLGLAVLVAVAAATLLPAPVLVRLFGVVIALTCMTTRVVLDTLRGHTGGAAAERGKAGDVEEGGCGGDDGSASELSASSASAPWWALCGGGRADEAAAATGERCGDKELSDDEDDDDDASSSEDETADGGASDDGGLRASCAWGVVLCPGDAEETGDGDGDDDQTVCRRTPAAAAASSASGGAHSSGSSAGDDAGGAARHDASACWCAFKLALGPQDDDASDALDSSTTSVASGDSATSPSNSANDDDSPSKWCEA